MTQQEQTIEVAIDEAIEALPNGNDRQLLDWVMTHRHPSFPKTLRVPCSMRAEKPDPRSRPQIGRHTRGVRLTALAQTPVQD
jgi:hypothetical protein